jgi:hypothetical protein
MINLLLVVRGTEESGLGLLKTKLNLPKGTRRMKVDGRDKWHSFHSRELE